MGNGIAIAHMFSEAFAPAEARELVRRLDFRYSPKHGSWLNVAENELSSLYRQCLRDRRFGTTSGGNHGMVAEQQRKTKRRRLAIPNRRCTNKTEVAVP
jgi:hypothetical protein